MKNRKTVLILLAVFLTACLFMPSAVSAEEDFSNTEYWNNLCGNTASLTEEQTASCKAYLQYIRDRNTALQQEITESGGQEEEITRAIEQSQMQINAMQDQVDGMTAMITDLNDQIEAAEKQSEVLQKEIEDNGKKIEEQEEKVRKLKARVSDRIVEQQSSMRLNPAIEMLFGAGNLHDMILIANGLDAISQKDSRTLEEMNRAIDELSKMKEQLLFDKEELDTLMEELTGARSVLDAQYTELMTARTALLQTQANYNSQLSALAQAKTDAEGSLSANNEAIREILDNMSNQQTPSPSADGSTPAPGTPAPAPSAPTPAPVTAPPAPSSASNPYWGGWSNCTWGCWQLVYDTLGIALPGWGFSGGWLNDAARSGYSTGNDPAVYSIAVYSWHVAFVTAVDGDMVYIKEGNYLGHYGERWVPAHGTLPYSSQKILGYIYL